MSISPISPRESIQEISKNISLSLAGLSMHSWKRIQSQGNPPKKIFPIQSLIIRINKFPIGPTKVMALSNTRPHTRQPRRSRAPTGGIFSEGPSKSKYQKNLSWHRLKNSQTLRALAGTSQAGAGPESDQRYTSGGIFWPLKFSHKRGGSSSRSRSRRSPSRDYHKRAGYEPERRRYSIDSPRKGYENYRHGPEGGNFLRSQNL